MTRSEWISVISKAKALAEGKDETCFNMFGYLLDAMKAQPVYSRSDEGQTEEDEE